MGRRKETPSTNPNPLKDFLPFFGIVLAAYIGYLGIRSQTEIPIRATQTAEAGLTLAAQSTAQPTPVEATLTPAPTEPLLPTSPPSTYTPSMTATPELSSITGNWEGITGGFKDGSPLTEVITTVTIPDDCQLGDSCGFFNTYCTYEMTLIEIQENVYVFETMSVSGEDFCNSNGTGTPARAELTLVSDSKLYFYYETSGGNVTREGLLTRQE